MYSYEPNLILMLDEDNNELDPVIKELNIFDLLLKGPTEMNALSGMLIDAIIKEIEYENMPPMIKVFSVSDYNRAECDPIYSDKYVIAFGMHRAYAALKLNQSIINVQVLPYIEDNQLAVETEMMQKEEEEGIKNLNLAVKNRTLTQEEADEILENVHNSRFDPSIFKLSFLADIRVSNSPTMLKQAKYMIQNNPYFINKNK